MMDDYMKQTAAILRSDMHKVNEYHSSVDFVFGTIESGQGLKMDHVDYTIPKGEYLTFRPYKKITLENIGATGLTAEEQNVFNALLNKCTIKANADLANGDRVLVAIYNNEPVVLGFLT